MNIFEQLRPLLKSIDPEISQLWNDYGQEIQRIKIVSNEEELLSVLSAYICLIGELQIKGQFNLPVMWILPIGIFLISIFSSLNFSSSDYISLILFFSIFIFAYLYISTRKFIYLIYFIIILSLYLIPVFLNLN